MYTSLRDTDRQTDSRTARAEAEFKNDLCLFWTRNKTCKYIQRG